MFGAIDKVFDETEEKTAEYRDQTAINAPVAGTGTGTGTTEGMSIREQRMADFGTSTYGKSMQGVSDDLKKIANAEY